MKRLLAAIVFVTAWAGSASGQDAPATGSDPMRAIYESLAARWTGSGARLDFSTGETVTTSEAFTASTERLTGVDFAYWDASATTLIGLGEDGAFTGRSYVGDSAVFELEGRYVAVSPPDEAGDWSFTKEYVISSPGSVPYTVREDWVMAGDGLSVEVFVLLDEAGGDYTLTASLSYQRAAPAERAD